MIRNNPKSSEGTWLWLLKIIAGLLIVALLGIHFVVNHLVAPGGLLSYEDVLQYYQNPIIPIMEGFFLVFVVTHAILGLRSILLDLNPTSQKMKWIDRILFFLGAAAVVYGVWLLIIMVLRGNA